MYLVIILQSKFQGNTEEREMPMWRWLEKS